MDSLSLLDESSIHRVLSCLQQADALSLVSLASCWPKLSAIALRQLVLKAKTSVAPIAAVLAAGGCQHLRSLRVEGPLDLAHAKLLQRLVSLRPRLERVLLQDLNLGPGTDAQALRVLLDYVATCPTLLTLKFSGLYWASGQAAGAEGAGFGEVEGEAGGEGRGGGGGGEEEAAEEGGETEGASKSARASKSGDEDGSSHSSGSRSRDRGCLSFFSVQQDASTADPTLGTSAVTSLSLTSSGFVVPLFLHSGQQWSRPFLEQLESLDLTASCKEGLGLKGLAEALPKMIRLRTLVLAGNGMGQEGLQLIGPGLAALRPSLEVLDLSANGLGPEGLEDLSRLLDGFRKLSSLALRGAWIGNDGVDALISLLGTVAPQIEDLDISQNRLQLLAMRQLFASWPDTPKLRKLNLSENAIFGAWRTPEEERGFAQAWERFAGKISDVEVLHLRGTAFGSSLASLPQILGHFPTNLKDLSLAASQLSAEGLRSASEFLPSLPKLEVLGLVQARLTDQELPELGALLVRFPSLHTLDLRGNRLSPTGVKTLEQTLRAAGRSLKDFKFAARPAS